MSLREQMESDITAVFLNTDEHAESITYTPKGGAARTVTAIVDEEGNYADEMGNLTAEEVVDVFTSRDEDGISNPQPGDTISFTRNGHTVLCSFVGVTSDKDDFGGWTRFKKATRKRMGGAVESL